VTIARYKQVQLTNSTAELGSVLLAGTLSFSNWNTTLLATNVTVAQYGVVTHYPCDTNVAAYNTNRIWIICSNLNVQTGGTITAFAKGFVLGQGPGTGAGGYAGSGHGGIGGSISSGGTTYGSLTEPICPGTGARTRGTAGGGAIRIEASGDIRLDGSLTAGANQGGDIRCGASGGSVWIDCRTLAGGGSIAAEGCKPNYPDYADYGGGGGRIALYYDTNAQASVSNCAVQFNASGGASPYYFASERCYGMPGTVYVPDARLLTSSPTLLGGVYHVASTNVLVFPQLTLSNGMIAFPGGYSLTVRNNMMISGAGGVSLADWSLSVGGNLTLSNAPYGKFMFFGASNHEDLVINGDFTVAVTGTHVQVAQMDIPNRVRLTVGGNLTFPPGISSIPIYSCSTNYAPQGSVTNYSTLIDVRGRCTMPSGVWFNVFSHPTNGGTTLFRFGYLTVDAGAGMNANGRGYRRSDPAGVTGQGPGGGGVGLDPYCYSGGGYGGLGGDAKFPCGQTYGSSNAPCEPGSGGGAAVGAVVGSDGGGAIRIEARRDISMNGTLSANGVDFDSGPNGAGSGGCIYLRCLGLYGSGTLSARGGNNASPWAGSGGGGGRIAGWCTYNCFATSNANVSGGTSAGTARNFPGQVGTIVWGYVPLAGTVISVK
jgi:hypothetical protein